MSCTSTYELYKTKVKLISEHGNGWGSGPAIWDYVSLKLRGIKFGMSMADSFWPLYEDSRLDDDERAVLLSTYDNSFVEIDRLADFAKACWRLHALIIEETQWTWNHFAAIAEDAERLRKKHDHRCRGLAIACTSGCDLWMQDKIENIDAWGVYERIEEIKRERAA